ncbi:MAG: adenylosuccinate lyase [Candidatus Omnitrophota bacterium]|nr:adenylosuccinate lyase [Candidatus Omnitrophota bacterium]
MIKRYTLPEMGKIWEDENKFRKWLEVELLTVEALKINNRIPPKDAAIIKRKAKFNIPRIREIEKEVRHETIAFLTNVAEYIGPAARYLHYGLTSYDALDTAQAVQMQEAADIIIRDIKQLILALRAKAKKYKKLVCVGRSHGIHAEPTTFGLKMALFSVEMERNLSRMKRAREVISVGKLSGAVGTFANVSPSVEAYVCKKLGLKPAILSTQVLARDRIAEFISVMAITAGTLERFAVEIRSLQRTEIREAEEPFSSTQKGSSAMPHKRNPIILERICGLARVLRGNALIGIENIALWNERDISHSSAERIILPDSTIILDYMLNKMIRVIKGLSVYPENMQHNLNQTKGLIFSERLMLELINKGLSRERAYRIIQRNAMKVWRESTDYKKQLLADKELGRYLKPAEISACFDLSYHTKNIDWIYKKLKI